MLKKSLKTLAQQIHADKYKETSHSILNYTP